MSIVFKPVKGGANVNIESMILHKSVLLTTGSEGVFSIQLRSGSNTDSGSYWNSLRANFYLSSTYGLTQNKYTYSFYKGGCVNNDNPQHLNKFHSTGSMISIPVLYIGEGIHTGSLLMRDYSTGNTITIVDDEYGNLYSPNAELSQSAESPLNSSVNYIGNVFYDWGIIVITDTGSWASGVPYSSIGTGNYDIQFKATKTIRTLTYEAVVEPDEFNYTMNVTAREPKDQGWRRVQDVSGSYVVDVDGNPILSRADDYSLPAPTDMSNFKSSLLNSNWKPLLTTIGLYNDNNELIAVAKYPQPIKMRDDMRLTFRIKIDI